MDKYARKCSFTGRGMNEGYVFGDGQDYAINEKIAKEYVESLGLDWEQELQTVNTEEEWFYWTEWEELDEDYYFDKQGNISQGNISITDWSNTGIAEFMGLKYNRDQWTIPLDMNCDSARIWSDIEGGYLFGTELLRFNVSWDWLMPVVQLCKERQIFGSQHLIDKIDTVFTCDLEIEHMYDAVVEFIKYYNSKI